MPLPSLTRIVKEVKDGRFGKSAVVEVNGDLLQVLTRMYWFTGKREYLDWAVEIGDYYLNDERLPTVAMIVSAFEIMAVRLFLACAKCIWPLIIPCLKKEINGRNTFIRCLIAF